MWRGGIRRTVVAVNREWSMASVSRKTNGRSAHAEEQDVREFPDSILNCTRARKRVQRRRKVAALDSPHVNKLCRTAGNSR